MFTTTAQRYETISNTLHALLAYHRATQSTHGRDYYIEERAVDENESWVVTYGYIGEGVERSWVVDEAWGLVEVATNYSDFEGHERHEIALSMTSAEFPSRRVLAERVLRAVIGRDSIPANSRAFVRDILESARLDAKSVFGTGRLTLALEGVDDPTWPQIDYAGRDNYGGLYGYLRTTGVPFDALRLYDHEYTRTGAALTLELQKAH